MRTPTKETSKAPTREPPRDVVRVKHYVDDNPDDAISRRLSRPEITAALAIQAFDSNHEVNALAAELTAQARAVKTGDMGRPEAMLVAQAHTLDALFSVLARRAHSNMVAGQGEAAERNLRLALKAQSQCRTTVEALAEIKNPRPVAFVKQANIAHGPQQVNNGVTACAREQSEMQPNELSGAGNELLPDTRAPQAASRIDTAVEALGEIDRAEVVGR